MKGYMLDTNVFNHLIEGSIQLTNLPKDNPIFVTHLQFNEISNCPITEKRELMLELIKELPDDMIPTNTAICGISAAGHCRIGNGKIYSEILAKLDTIKTRKNNSNAIDSLIGETSIIENLTLISNDQSLIQIVSELGGTILDLRSGVLS